MSVMIKDILQLEVFKNHKLLAGKDGLTNLVDKVGIIDHETEDMIIGSYEKGEFVISTFFIIKNNASKLFDYVRNLVQANTSGLAIKDIYFSDIPQNVIDFADENNFPIFIFQEVFYEDIITSIVNAIKDKQCIETVSLKIDNILTGNLNTIAIKKLALKINRNFAEKHAVVFCKAKNTNKALSIWQFLQKFKPFNRYNSIIPYNNGYLIIYTFQQLKEADYETIIINRLSDIGFNCKDYNIGVSSLYYKLDQLYLSINESMFAYTHTLTTDNNISYFYRIGTSKILIPVLDNLWVKKYLNEMITPLLEYDKHNDVNLVKTALIYVENNGDIKLTAQRMFQHTNTIRYRINKIKKVLDENNYVQDFYHELSIAVKLYKLFSLK